MEPELEELGSEECDSEGEESESEDGERAMARWMISTEKILELNKAGKKDDAILLDVQRASIRLDFFPSPRYLVDIAEAKGFEECPSPASEEQVKKLVEWAKMQPSSFWPFGKSAFELSMRLVIQEKPPKLPNGVDQQLFQELTRILSKEILAIPSPVPAGHLAQVDWSKVERNLQGTCASQQQKSQEIRDPPYPSSAPVAIFNPDLKSEDWEALPALKRSLHGCCLASSQSHLSFSAGKAKKETFSAPQDLHLRGLRMVDLEGDILAFWHDKLCGSVRSEAWALGFCRPPSPGLRTRSDFGGFEVPKHSWVSQLLVDGRRQQVWAGDTRNGEILGFEIGKTDVSLRLSLPRACENSIGLAAYGDRLLAASAESGLCVWALEGLKPPVVQPNRKRKFIHPQSEEGEEEEDFVDDDFFEDSSDGVQVAGRQNPPTAKLSLKENLPFSQCQRLSSSWCLFAGGPHSDELEDEWEDELEDVRPPQNPAHTSMHVVDIQAEKTLMTLCGHNSTPSIERQLCAESHQLVFSSSPGLALVFDLRTSLPVLKFGGIERHSELCTGVLGVPTPATPIAFTHQCDECIRAWDIRIGSTSLQSWMVATGNLQVRQLAWHAPSFALYAATYSDHAVSYGTFSHYQYGEDLSDASDPDWPRRPLRPRNFFPAAFHRDNDCLLRYVFRVQNPRVPSLLDLCARALRSNREVPDALMSRVCCSQFQGGVIL